MCQVIVYLQLGSLFYADTSIHKLGLEFLNCDVEFGNACGKSPITLNGIYL